LLLQQGQNDPLVLSKYCCKSGSGSAAGGEETAGGEGDWLEAGWSSRRYSPRACSLPGAEGRAPGRFRLSDS